MTFSLPSRPAIELRQDAIEAELTGRGANGSIGTSRVARAASDGYTLVVGIWNTHVANGAVYALQYDVVKDFEPILLLADAPLLLVASKSVPANDLKEFIAWLKLNPDKSSMGTVGAGSPGHLLGLVLQKERGARFGLVAYRGAGSALQDVVAGQIETVFANTATSLPQVRAGSIKALAVTAQHRLAIAPDIQSVDEAGLPGLRFMGWPICAQGHTEEHHQQAQYRSHNHAERSNSTREARRAGL